MSAAGPPRRTARQLEAWREANRPFELNDYTGPTSGPLWQFDRRRRSSVVITAVHGVRHTRSEAIGKSNDANTGGLALVLANEHKMSVGLVRRSDAALDVNSDPEHPFKAALIERLRPAPGHYLVDLHGMSDSYEVDVALGLGRDPSPEVLRSGERVRQALLAADLSVDFGGEATGLRGAGPGTLTTWAGGVGLIGLQLEIRQGLRSFRSPSSERTRLIRGLSNALEAVAADD